MNIAFFSKLGGPVVVYTPPKGGSIESHAAAVVPSGFEYFVIPDEQLPAPGSASWTFLGAWDLSASGIALNMAKAREIKRDMIRAERAPMLAALDVEFMRAVESGDVAKQQEIAAEKQRLRDATQHPSIDAAQTPDELKNLNPLSV